ncbi:MAG: surface-layer protein, partial [Clostridiaceae bacterium]|nr:surface-layer protein [Clostridiaceae bacterium]
MRNLKKLFAVVMVVAMLASMMVPALAAGVEYEDEATILQDLGLFQGYGAGELGLADDLTREQGLALMLRVMGLEDEVKAMTEEEVAAELARVVDPETVTATWAKPYVAYAVKNGLTKGIDASILPNVKFAGQLKMTGKEFINLMLNGMGYATAWDDVLT